MSKVLHDCLSKETPSRSGDSIDKYKLSVPEIGPTSINLDMNRLGARNTSSFDEEILPQI